MNGDITFNEVCKLLKHDDTSLINLLDKLLGASILFSPLVFGPAAIPFLELLQIKDEVINLAKDLLNKVSIKKDQTYLEKFERMKICYGLICYTSFFSAIDHDFDDYTRTLISLKVKDKKAIIAYTVTKRKDKTSIDENCDNFNDLLFQLPHPTTSARDLKDHLIAKYSQMTNMFENFIKFLYDNNNEKEISRIREIIRQLPSSAYRFFEAQYYYLATSYNDFWIWIQLNEKKYDIRSEFVQKYIQIIERAKSQIDVGLLELQKTLQSLSLENKSTEINHMIDNLDKYYKHIIDKPIIEDKEIIDERNPILLFPKISKSFIPQPYSTLRYLDPNIHLEKESTWDKTEVYNDLSAFIIRYLSSPYSIQTPLLILGHPGSGKSLLTKVLSARIMCSMYTPVRIQLRDIDADEEFDKVIIKQVEKDAGGFHINSWSDFMSQLANRPLLVILDGYDELLQASKKSLSSYLDRVKEFQQNQLAYERPIHAIVTSRITLIDKVVVPIGTTVVRLREFSQKQIDQWINIWNSTNYDFFTNSNIHQFSLPNRKDILSSNIFDLAKQPLLLLMLAIYDSEDNSLHKNILLDRSNLYDSLLRRFIRRERRRYITNFDYMQPNLQEQIIDQELRRLGVAAIGMYNRRKLYISSSELLSDLKSFDLIRNIETNEFLSEADLIVGSFFFVHVSVSYDYIDCVPAINTTFEFLHNTFAEFLVANFVICCSIQDAKILQSYQIKSSKLDGESKPYKCSSSWFSCFMFSPLFSWTVILEMMREWISPCLEKASLAYTDFIACIDSIIKDHLLMILYSGKLPDGLADNIFNVPLLGRIATYTLNIIIFRSMISITDYVFDEDHYLSIEKNILSNDIPIKPWDKLSFIWRTWYKLEMLYGLTAILTIERKENQVRIKAKKEFGYSPVSKSIDKLFYVAEVLGDNILAGLIGMHTCLNDNLDQARYLNNQLKKGNIDIDLEFNIRELRHLITEPHIKITYFEDLLEQCLCQISQYGYPEYLMMNFIDLLYYLKMNNILSIKHEQKILMTYTKNMLTFLDNKIYTIEWLKLLKLYTHNISDEIITNFKDLSLSNAYLKVMLENSSHVLAWLKFVNSLNDKYYGEQFISRVVDQILSPAIPEMINTCPELYIECLLLTSRLEKCIWLEYKANEFVIGFLSSERFLFTANNSPEIAVKWLTIILTCKQHKKNKSALLKHFISDYRKKLLADADYRKILIDSQFDILWDNYRKD